MAITLDGTTGITASGNITGNYILGNGSQLSGIITSVSSLSNGTSNVVATSSGGNVTVGVGGTPNVAVFTATGANIAGTFNVTGNTALANVLIAASKSIDVGNNKITNVAEPVANSDAATKSYVDSATSSGFTVQDDTANTTVVSGGDTLQLYGTANEVTVGITTTDQVTFGLPDNVTVTGNLSAGNLSTTGLLSVSGNASAGNISTAGKVTASGNVAGSYFIGDGSLLTNLPAQAGNAISNGTSNVAIPTSSGNVTVGINGTANTVVISPGSIFVNGLFASPKTITSNVQMAADSTAAVISPLTIGNGYNMSIPTSSTVYVWIPS